MRGWPWAIDMNVSKLETIEQIKEFLDGTACESSTRDRSRDDRLHCRTARGVDEYRSDPESDRCCVEDDLVGCVDQD